MTSIYTLYHTSEKNYIKVIMTCMKNSGITVTKKIIKTDKIKTCV